MIEQKSDEITFKLGFPTIGIMKMKENAVIPHRAHVTDAGFDLYAAESVVIPPMGTVVIGSGIAVDLPTGWEADIRGSSGRTNSSPLRVQLGTIDSGYNGEIKIVCDNFNMNESLEIEVGDKIAQMIIFEQPKFYSKEVISINEKDKDLSRLGSKGNGRVISNG